MRTQFEAQLKYLRNTKDFNNWLANLYVALNDAEFMHDLHQCLYTNDVNELRLTSQVNLPNGILCPFYRLGGDLEDKLIAIRKATLAAKAPCIMTVHPDVLIQCGIDDKTAGVMFRVEESVSLGGNKTHVLIASRFKVLNLYSPLL